MISRLQLELWLASLGKVPFALLIGLLGVIVLWLGLIPRQQYLTSRERQQLATLVSAPSTAHMAAAMPSSEPLVKFKSSLADDAELARCMEEIWSRGSNLGLQVSKVDYHQEPEPSGLFGRVQIAVPVTGNYLTIRKFIFGLMAEHPALALQKLDMKREQVSSGQVDVTAHFTLHMQP